MIPKPCFEAALECQSEIILLDNMPPSAAAQKHKIDKAVLDKLGELTSEVGDLATARKFDPSSTKRAHTGAETDWVIAAVKMLIRRIAEYASDPAASMAQITMVDLPKI